MCGITGIKLFNSSHSLNADNLNRSLATLSKRGPDYSETFTTHSLGLGHARLSILDVSANANQPMHDDTGRYVLIYNGEIYNYKELSSSVKGVDFKSTSDTEVLLYLLIREGATCLNKLNGFFALAFYDRQEDSLLLARDRMGIKPLLYHHNNDSFSFSSEMKALLSYDIPKKINYEALHWYMRLSYVPGNMSMIAGIHKLERGHFLQIQNNQIRKESFVNSNPAPKDSQDYDSSCKQLVKLLDRSVQQRLISDVPIGSFLSGGTDSSVIVALASSYHDSLNTFSIGYKDSPYFDETRYAELVASKFKTNHTTFLLSNDDLLNDFSDTINYIDEPLADPSMIPTYILSKNTSKKVKVALSGDGADELFGGYYKHMALRNAEQKSLFNSAIKSMSGILRLFPKTRNDSFSDLSRRINKYATLLKLNERERYWYLASMTSNASEYLVHKTLESTLEDFKSTFSGTNPTFNDYLITDQQVVLPGNMLPKVDLMSMANGLEVRVPFLDRNVVNFANELPPEFKVNGRFRKKILQDAFRHILPKELYKRPKKGFDVPLQQWMQAELQEELNTYVFNRDLLNEQSLFNAEKVMSLKLKLDSKNSEDAELTIWTIYIFQKWYLKYFQ